MQDAPPPPPPSSSVAATAATGTSNHHPYPLQRTSTSTGTSNTSLYYLPSTPQLLDHLNFSGGSNSMSEHNPSDPHQKQHHQHQSYTPFTTVNVNDPNNNNSSSSSTGSSNNAINSTLNPNSLTGIANNINNSTNQAPVGQQLQLQHQLQQQQPMYHAVPLQLYQQQQPQANASSYQIMTAPPQQQQQQQTNTAPSAAATPPIHNTVSYAILRQQQQQLQQQQLLQQQQQSAQTLNCFAPTPQGMPQQLQQQQQQQQPLLSPPAMYSFVPSAQGTAVTTAPVMPQPSVQPAVTFPVMDMTAWAQLWQQQQQQQQQAGLGGNAVTATSTNDASMDATAQQQLLLQQLFSNVMAAQQQQQQQQMQAFPAPSLAATASGATTTVPRALPTTMAPVPPRGTMASNYSHTTGQVGPPPPPHHHPVQVFSESWKTMWDDEPMDDTNTSSLSDPPPAPVSGNIYMMDATMMDAAAAATPGQGESLQDASALYSTTYATNIHTANDSAAVNDPNKRKLSIGAATTSITTGVDTSAMTTTASTPAAPSSDQWAPTPLSEIRAKQLRRQVQRVQQSPPTGDGAATPATTQSNESSSLPQQQQQQSYLMPTQSFAPQQTAQQVCLAPRQQHPLLQPPVLLPQPVILHQPQQLILQQQPLPTAALGGATHPQQEQPVLTVDMAHQLRQYHLQLQQLQLQTQQQPPQTTSPDATSQDSGVSSQSTRTPAQHQQHRSALALPSTVLPPSVLTSLLPSGARNTPQSTDSTSADTTVGATKDGNAPVAPAAAARLNKAQSNYKKRGATTTKSARVECPQDVLERITSMRGFSFSNRTTGAKTLRIKSADACYDSVPSPLQLASFGTELVKAIHAKDVVKLSRLLRTGLSPNPCNQFRDSIVDLVCKRANASVFQCLVEHGCDVRVCDGFGRTPMHHCCWASEFSLDIANRILRADLQQLFMEDKRGQTPLEYVRAEQSKEWIDYLEDNANRLFPPGGQLPSIVSPSETRMNGYLTDPPKALPVSLAKLISSGALTPDQLDTMDAASRENCCQE